MIPSGASREETELTTQSKDLLFKLKDAHTPIPCPMPFGESDKHSLHTKMGWVPSPSRFSTTVLYLNNPHCLRVKRNSCRVHSTAQIVRCRVQ